MTTQGVDYSTEKPSISGLQAVGKVFACRYGGPGTSPKHLTLTEAQELAAHGLSIVANAEGVTSGLLGGWDTGVAWARKAEAHFAGCGMPPGRPIYLSVDFDCTSAQWPQVAEALKGAASVLTARRVGVYGGYDTIVWAARDQVARWFWQTFAWSEQRWHPLAHLRQYRNGVSLVGGTVDLDQAMVADYGQWQPVGTQPELGDDDMSEETAQQIKDLHYNMFTLDNVDRPDGSDAGRIQNTASGVVELLATVDGIRHALDISEATDHGPLIEKIDAVLAKLDEVVNTPLIDAVAVAQAIATDPTILGAIASGVARQLATVEGTVTLTGSLAAGIRPPVA